MIVKRLFFQRSGSNCGMEFVHFYGIDVPTGEKDAWGYVRTKRKQFPPSYEMIAEAIVLDSKGMYPLPSLTIFPLKSYVVFSENEGQNNKDNMDYLSSPTEFYNWLIKEKETVVVGPWQVNSGSRNKIRAYFWLPSDNFKEKVDRLAKKLVVQQVDEFNKKNNKAQCTTSTSSAPA